jgi:hypothetical protein
VTWDQPPPTTPAPDGPIASAAAPPVEADLVAAAVLACPAVVALHAGGFREVATYLPGRRVVGVRTEDTAVEVSVVATAGLKLPAVAAQIRSALAPLAGGRRIDVHIADISLPGDPTPMGLTSASTAASVAAPR